ncbi:hypothetical protein TSUD_182950 [Trifolium subterraneum]|uniref:Uncharacterized protein n=1 Tax=Trifolium subterraneum TaxID=3900 RepID=A0A2Z6NPB0_TRISU|nr:hypothetical protein TSUD_182950 [Trifolium subterraneum]
MTKKDSSKGSKLSKYMKAPLRILKKVRDMYVHGMIQCSHDLAYVNHATIGYPTQFYSLPRSFSVNSTTSHDDFKELVRAASLKIRDSNHVELGAEAMKVPRSHSVGIGRIEEDKVCEFEDIDDDNGNDDIKVKPLLYSRSRSCAIRNGASMF